MNKICTNCGNEFETNRKDKLFCSGKCRVSHLRNVTDDKQNVTDQPESVTLQRNVTKLDVTVKEDSETRSWLIQQFEAEGKSPDEIEKIMMAQDNYYQSRSYYFIPTRMLSSRGMFGTQETTQEVNN